MVCVVRVGRDGDLGTLEGGDLGKVKRVAMIR